VVRQRPAGHTGPVHDLLLPRSGEAVLGEQRPGGIEQGLTGGGGPFGLGSPGVVDRHQLSKFNAGSPHVSCKRGRK
jgi:hypothetical protein